MSNYKVYLAGPITGLTAKGASDWRNDVIVDFKSVGVQGLSPMRGKAYLEKLGKLSGTGEEYAHMSPLSTGKGITTRDRFDCTRCDVLLVNLLGATSVSVGTVMEIAWADLKRIPIVVAIEERGNPHEHLMINDAVSFKAKTLPEAVELAKMILGV